MSELEHDLRDALRRQEPSADFADRVLSCAADRRRRGRRAPMRWAAAAVLVAAIGGGIQYRAMRDERARGEAAKEQVVRALRIAGAKLQIVQARVREVGS